MKRLSALSLSFVSLLLVLLGFRTAAADTPSDKPNWWHAVQTTLQQSYAFAERVQFEVLSPSAVTNKLKACDSAEAAFPHKPAANGGRLLIQISCRNSPIERPYLLQIKAQVFAHYWVTQRDLDAGDVLSASNVKQRFGDISVLPRNVLTNQHKVHGMALRRALKAESSLRPSIVSRPKVVTYGDAITITAQGQGFTIRRSGKALDTGAVGDIIRIQLDNQQVLRAKVTAAGQAQVKR